MNHTRQSACTQSNENGHAARPTRGIRQQPFRKGAQAARDRGWPVVPTSRRGTKSPLAKGITGYDGIDASDEQLADLIARYPYANLGLRLPFDVLGLDVDAYDGRAGAATLASLTAELGPLPTTYRSTSRAPEDPVSGIYLYRAPREMDWKWVGDLGPGSGIEIIQRHHRFVSCWPSVHNSTKRIYAWWRGNEQADIPRPTDLPLLPVKWAAHLLSSRRYQPRERVTGRELAEWYGRVHAGPMCAGMEQFAILQATEVRAAAAEGGLHQALFAAAADICRMAADGCTGLDRALGIVEKEAIQAQEMRDRDLQAEWEGAVSYGMAQAAALAQCETDVCTLRGMRVRKAR